MTLLSRPSWSARTRGPQSASAGAATALSALSSRLLTPRRLAQGRTGVGVVMLTSPTAVPRLLGVDSAAAQRTGWAVQMLGAREVALGAGAWVALRRGDGRAARLWLAAGLLSDALDAVIVAGAIGRGRVRPGAGAAAVAVATTASAVQVAALAKDGDPFR